MGVGQAKREMIMPAFCAFQPGCLLFVLANRPSVAGLSMGLTSLLDNLTMVATWPAAL
jgi:hypothetical protein